MRLPAEIEQKIAELLGMPDFNPQDWAKYKRIIDGLREGIFRLADSFADYDSTADAYADAYFVYNFPQTYEKITAVVKRILHSFPDLLKRESYKILDIGCGHGAGMFGLQGILRNVAGSASFSLTGVDLSGQALDRCRVMGNWLNKKNYNFRLRLSRCRVDKNYFKAASEKYDILLFANSLAEIVAGEDIPLKFFDLVFKSLKTDGIVIIIEPALKYFTRRLMSVREAIVTSGTGQVMLPCLYNSECPLLKMKKEWCHTSIKWEPTDLAKLLNEKLNREIDYLKFSYLVLSKITMESCSSGAFLVISHLLKEKGRMRCYLCTPQGRIELFRLDRSRSASNAGFDRITKGAVVTVKNTCTSSAGSWKVTEETELKLIHTWYS